MPELSAPSAATSLVATVTVAPGRYRLADGGGHEAVLPRAVHVGRHPVTCAQMARFAALTSHPVSAALRLRLDARALRDHPVTEVTYADALAFCTWATTQTGRRVRLPAGDEWEAAARGPQARTWPWGDTFDPERCNAAESGWGWTTPVGAHPSGASWCGAEDLAGNVWEWVGDDPDEDGWRTVRGGSYLDTAWGLRAARTLPADPERATATTGFRVVVEGGTEDGAL